MTAAQLGPWLFVSVGDAWIRVDQIAAITQWEIVMVGQSAPISLGDDVSADDVLRWIAAHVKRLGSPVRLGAEPVQGWRFDHSVVDDGPAMDRGE